MAASDEVPNLTNLLASAHAKPLTADSLHIGVLALQGAFVEHAHMLGQIGARTSEVRQLAHLTDDLDGLVIPGGESTAMAIVAQTLDMVEPLKAFVRSGRPVFGTCAGLIFLSDHATGQKIGGQSLLGGLDVIAHRNFFGSQIDSSERPVELTGSLAGGKAETHNDGYRHVFIRAPAIIQANAGVEVLATLAADARETGLLKEQFAKDEIADGDSSRVIVAAQQGSVLCTAFHPELTDDFTWHSHFLEMVKAHKRASASGKADGGAAKKKRTAK